MIEIDKKYSERNLRNMRKFYILFKNEIWNAVRSELTWTHIRELLHFTDEKKINYYSYVTKTQNLSSRELHERIKNKEYERLNNEIKEKLELGKKEEVQDFIKNPILIRNTNQYAKISEKTLQNLIVEDITHFMKVLGEGFCYIKNEFKIKIGDRYNYIDLLLFNIKYNCYVVVELKVTELKKEHIGQITTYMHYVDKNIRNINQEKTIGIIIVRKDNKFIMKYCSDKRVYQTTYSLRKVKNIVEKNNKIIDSGGVDITMDI